MKDREFLDRLSLGQPAPEPRRSVALRFAGLVAAVVVGLAVWTLLVHAVWTVTR